MNKQTLTQILESQVTDILKAHKDKGLAGDVKRVFLTDADAAKLLTETGEEYTPSSFYARMFTEDIRQRFKGRGFVWIASKENQSFYPIAGLQ